MNEKEMSEMEWLQKWYLIQCDGEWEHDYGIRIDTLDNPGWEMKIDLRRTKFDDKNFTTISKTDNDNSWWDVKIENSIFIAHCGALDLVYVIKIFRNWIESNK